jgi:hypothetical protein
MDAREPPDSVGRSSPDAFSLAVELTSVSNQKAADRLGQLIFAITVCLTVRRSKSGPPSPSLIACYLGMRNPLLSPHPARASLCGVSEQLRDRDSTPVSNEMEVRNS